MIGIDGIRVEGSTQWQTRSSTEQVTGSEASQNWGLRCGSAFMPATAKGRSICARIVTKPPAQHTPSRKRGSLQRQAFCHRPRAANGLPLMETATLSLVPAMSPDAVLSIKSQLPRCQSMFRDFLFKILIEVNLRAAGWTSFTTLSTLSALKQPPPPRKEDVLQSKDSLQHQFANYELNEQSRA